MKTITNRMPFTAFVSTNINKKLIKK